MRMWWLFFLYLTGLAFLAYLVNQNTPNYAGEIDSIGLPMSDFFGWIWLFSSICFIAAFLTEVTEFAYDNWVKKQK